MTASLSRIVPGVRHLRRAAARLTAPLLPDDYLSMINPLWSARELRGRVVTVIPETADAATLVIKPGWGWRFDHQPGQYVGIAVAVAGRFALAVLLADLSRRRTTEATSPSRSKRCPKGCSPNHLVRGLEPGTIVRLAPPRGEFVLPDPPPPKLLFVTAGSGHHAGDGDAAHDGPPRHPARRRADALGPGRRRRALSRELHDLQRRHPGLRPARTVHPPRRAAVPGRRSGTGLPGLAPAPGLGLRPERHARRGREGVDRRRPVGLPAPRTLRRRPVGGQAQGGTVYFAGSGRTIEVDGATTLLQAGEQAGIPMPFGCRMGICHTCVVPLDRRSGARPA